MNTGESKDRDKPVEKEFLYEELTSDVLDSSFKVHNSLGCGLLEKVYGNALAWELELRKRKVVPQKECRVTYRDKEVGLYYADLVVDDCIVIEVKSVEKIENVHRAQLMNYLRLSGLKVGLLINFAKPRVEYERMVV